MPTISGTVYDETGSRAGGRIIRVYRRDTGNIIAAGLSATSALPFNDNPIASFSFETISSVAVPDDTGNYSVLFYNSPSLVTGVVGSNAVSFNGTNQYASLLVKNNITYNAASGGFALSFWCYRVQDNENSSILLKANDATNNTNGNRLNLHFPWSDGKWYWDFGSTTVGRVTGNWNSAWYSNWIHVVAQYTDTNRVQLWVNGVLQGETNSSATPQSMTLNENIWLAYYEATTPQYVNARVDKFRIFNRTLTPGEISILSTENTNGFGANTGDFSFLVPYTGECNVLVLDNAAGTTFNDKVHRVNVT